MSAPEGGWSTREPPLNVDDLRRRLTSQESSALGTVGMSGARRDPSNSSSELTHDRRMLTWTYFSVRKESLRTNAARWSQRRSVPISANSFIAGAFPPLRFLYIPSDRIERIDPEKPVGGGRTGQEADDQQCH